MLPPAEVDGGGGRGPWERAPVDGAPEWWGVNSLLFSGLLEDEGDELLQQQNADQKTNDPAHHSQDDECHCIVHFFHWKRGEWWGWRTV